MMAAEAPEPKRARVEPKQENVAVLVKQEDVAVLVKEEPVSQPPTADDDKVVVMKVICQASGSWRRIEILQSQTLKDLHAIIFKAFDRNEEHCYKFTSPVGDNYTRVCVLFGNSSRDALASCVRFVKQSSAVQADRFGPGYTVARVCAAIKEMPKIYNFAQAKEKENPTLGALKLKRDDTMTYHFDFGYGWSHLIIVEAVGVDHSASTVYPRIVGGYGQSKPQYPHMQAKDPLIISPEATQPFTAAERAEAEQYRQRETREVWSQKKHRLVAPTMQPWGSDEEKVLSLLIMANVKFADAWAQYLEPALLLRNKAASAGRYSQMKQNMSVSTDAQEKEKKLKAAIGLLRMHRELLLRKARVEDRALSAPEPEYPDPMPEDLFRWAEDQLDEDEDYDFF